MAKYDLESLEKAAARVRAKLKDFNDRWDDAHSKEMNEKSFFENRALVDQYFRELDEFLYKENHKK
jgi:hypothetical protein